MHFDDCSRNWCNPNHGIFGDRDRTTGLRSTAQWPVDQDPLPRDTPRRLQRARERANQVLLLQSVRVENVDLDPVAGSDFNAMHLGHGAPRGSKNPTKSNRSLARRTLDAPCRSAAVHRWCLLWKPWPRRLGVGAPSRESVSRKPAADATTTNQRMELEAAAEGLEALTEPANVR